MYLIRLDDACPYMDVGKWSRVEEILDKYGVKPIVAIIPDCQDKMFTDAYEKDDGFWEKAKGWQKKGWTVALHGYNHVYTNYNASGINPINSFSEFVGLSYEEQCKKIKSGTEIFKAHGLTPTCFVAPAHSFDENTVAAIKNETGIRVISDTIANDVYYEDDVFYIPQQCGHFRKIVLKTVTCCYHPNTMTDGEMRALDAALAEHFEEFTSADKLDYKKRRFGFKDYLFRKSYFFLRRFRKQKAISKKKEYGEKT